MRLAGAERDGQAVAVSDEVQLGREPAAAAPQRVVGGVVRPPRLAGGQEGRNARPLRQG